jgi:regulator of RNase E activity RraA
MRLDCCALSDALDKLGLHGCVTGLPALGTRRKIAGRVHTVRLVAKDKAPPMSGPPRLRGPYRREPSRIRRGSGP